MGPTRPATKHLVPAAGDICRMPALELARRIRRRELSVREVVAAFLDRIEAVNPHVNAVVSLRERADILREADALDAAAPDAGRGPLFGLPIAIKDLALTRGLRTTFGSPIFSDFVPQEDEFSVERIRKAGAVIVGKTNVPEFGLGSNTYNPVFGVTKNATPLGLGIPREAKLTVTGKPGSLQIRLVDPATLNKRPGLGGCVGDSGAPAFEADASGALRIVGVVSWSTAPNDEDGCGGLTGLTPLLLYRDWIVETAKALK